jgi:AcrR family transcriptional regulator
VNVPRRAQVSNAGPSGTDDTKARLLREAAHLFRTSGYAGASTRQLAARLGLQNASLYHYMDTKEDLLYEVCVDGWQRLRVAVDEATGDHDDPLKALKAAVRAHLRTTIDNRDVYITMLTEAKSLSPKRQKLIARHRTEYWERISVLVRDAQSAGQLRTDIPPTHLVLVLRNILAWTAFWYRSDGELDMDALHGLLTGVFLEGAGNQQAALSAVADLAL